MLSKIIKLGANRERICNFRFWLPYSRDGQTDGRTDGR